MKISLIVPAYNVAQYLPKCLDSLLNQGMPQDELEILVIDDGSPDDSGAIADRYAALHPEIRVIHQENRGLSGARNVGIEQARGDYLWFIDSDDWIFPGILPQLVEQMDKYQLDKLLFNYDKYPDGEEEEALQRVTVQNEKLDAQKLHFFDSAYEMNESPLVPSWRIICNAILRTELIRQSPLRFVEKTLFEDKEFNFWLDRLAGKCAFSEASLYFYRNRVTGIVHTAMSDERFPGYLAGRIRLAERMKNQVAEFDAGGFQWLRRPLTREELELRAIHEVQGIFKNLFEKGDRKYFDPTLEELKQKDLYPYPILLSSLRIPGQGMAAKLVALLFPVEPYLRLCFAVASRLKH